jgi:hypothetical protein
MSSLQISQFRALSQRPFPRPFHGHGRLSQEAFCYMAEQAAAESGVAAAERHEGMWTLFERGAVRLVGPVTDDGRVGVEPCDPSEWDEQAKRNGPLIEWRRQMATTVAPPTN